MLPSIRIAAITTLTLGLTFAAARAATIAYPVNLPTVSPTDAYIGAVYRDLLGRPADATGLSFWRTYLNNGGSRTGMAAQILATGEARSLLVQSFYNTYLGRPAAPAECAGLIGLLNQGATDSQGRGVVLGSLEYYAGHGQSTVEGFITALYKDVLGRPADPREVSQMGQIVNSLGRTQTALAVVDSSEGRLVRIKGWYLRYLGRPAAETDASYFLSLMNANITDGTLIATILGSAEYYQRCQR
jgi:hypothetical protein